MLGSPQADAAAISGGLALLAALYAHWRTAASNRALEKLKDGLASRRDDRNARRDYEYQARKHLYAEIEPLLFQLHEATEKAYHRSLSLARTSLNLGPSGWLGGEGYYLRSIIYILLTPAVLFRIIQRRMTFVDLDVDAGIRTKYELAKLYFFAFTDHYEFARLAPAIDYRPHERPRRGASAQERTAHIFQGIVLGRLDQMVDLMIVGEPQQERPVTFGQFEDILNAAKRPPVIADVVGLFIDFDPATRPVLARTLIGMAMIARLLMDSYRTDRAPSNLATLFAALVTDEAASTGLAWEEGSRQDLSLLTGYFADRLAQIDERCGRRNPS